MAYTANSASSELIAGPMLSTLSSAEGNGAAFVTPQKSESGVKAQRKLPNITNSGPLLDRWGRVATDLRISLTDKCNLRCIYCMPADGLQWLPKENLLSAEEIARLADIAITELGVEEIRFTGGEPLVRADLVDIISRIHQAHPDVPLAITTNGIGLEKRATALAEAGLTRINVSLDTICRETFAELTRRDKLDAVLKGIDGAAEAGLWPIKINAVLMPGLNDDQLRSFCAGHWRVAISCVLLSRCRWMPITVGPARARLLPLRFARSYRLSTFWVRWLRHVAIPPLSCGRCTRSALPWMRRASRLTVPSRWAVWALSLR